MNKTLSERLRTTIYEAIGEASMCWSETPKGVFDSARAKAAGDRIVAAIEASSVKRGDMDKICEALELAMARIGCPPGDNADADIYHTLQSALSAARSQTPTNDQIQ